MRYDAMRSSAVWRGGDSAWRFSKLPGEHSFHQVVLDSEAAVLKVLSLKNKNYFKAFSDEWWIFSYTRARERAAFHDLPKFRGRDYLES